MITLGIALLTGVLGVVTPMEETPVVVNPTITTNELKNGSVKLMVERGIPLEDFEKSTDLSLDDILVTDGNYLANDVAIFAFTPDEYYTIDTDSISIGVEQEYITKVTDEVTMYAFTLQENTNYVISADFDIDIKGIVEKYADKYGITDWYNKYVYPFLGVGIGTLATVLFNVLFTFIQKNQYKLENTKFAKRSNEVIDETREYRSICTNALTRADELIQKSDEATKEAKETSKKVILMDTKMNTFIDAFQNYINHDTNAVKTGVARQFNEALDNLKKEDTTNGENEEVK